MTVERRLALVAGTLAVSLLTACGADAGGSPSPAPSPTAGASEATPEPVEGVRLDVTITEDGTTPIGDRVDVEAGEPVTLVVTSEIADEVHVHSDPEVTIEVGPGETVERTLTIDRPGQVAVESHETGATILQLVVQP